MDERTLRGIMLPRIFPLVTEGTNRGGNMSQIMPQQADASITKLSKGYIIQVGCKTVAIEPEHIDVAMADLTLYLMGGNKAQIVYKKWFPEDFIQKAYSIDNETGQPNPPRYDMQEDTTVRSR